MVIKYELVESVTAFFQFSQNPEHFPVSRKVLHGPGFHVSLFQTKCKQLQLQITKTLGLGMHLCKGTSAWKGL